MSTVAPLAVTPARRWLAAATLVAAILAIVGAALDGPWRLLHWIGKPLTTVLIFLLAWHVRAPLSLAYRRWILLGIAASLCGDIWLMLPADLFVPGLLSFLVAHICFLLALSRDTPWLARPVALLACVAYAVPMLWLLWPGVAAPLRLPVLVYVAVLALMGAQALARAVVHARDALAYPTRLAALGAVCFMLSDSLLAWNRFRTALPWPALWVLVTYYAALWLLARSVAARPAVALR